MPTTSAERAHAPPTRPRRNRAPARARFDSRVKRQDVGLKRDAFDDTDNFSDPAGTCFNTAHRLDNLRNHAIATLGRLHGLYCDRLACRTLSVLWPTLDESSAMLAAVSCSEAACISVRRDRSRSPAEICGRRCDRIRVSLDAVDCTGQIRLHAFHRIEQAAAVVRLGRDDRREIVGRNSPGNLDRIAAAAYRPRDAAIERHDDAAHHQRDQHKDAEGLQQVCLKCAVDIVDEQARIDHPVPWTVRIDVRDSRSVLRHPGRFLRIVEALKSAAASRCQFDLLLDGSGLRIQFAQRFVLDRCVEWVHQHHTLRTHDREIAATRFTVTHAADHVHRLPLRLFGTQLARAGPLRIELDRGACDLMHEIGLAFLEMHLTIPVRIRDRQQNKTEQAQDQRQPEPLLE